MWPFRRKPHIHSGYHWDGYYERCKCGAWASDLMDKHGHRYIFFNDWPVEARRSNNGTV